MRASEGSRGAPVQRGISSHGQVRRHHELRSHVEAVGRRNLLLQRHGRGGRRRRADAPGRTRAGGVRRGIPPRRIPRVHDGLRGRRAVLGPPHGEVGVSLPRTCRAGDVLRVRPERLPARHGGRRRHDQDMGPEASQALGVHSRSYESNHAAEVRAFDILAEWGISGVQLLRRHREDLVDEGLEDAYDAAGPRGESHGNRCVGWPRVWDRDMWV
mmetsp:Transcript_1133/g.2776  ORF Transcript_1133/g.2776 Transcript_1133/m.2776 type:complete len:214 (-) Transcript_1133:325-966(-)